MFPVFSAGSGIIFTQSAPGETEDFAATGCVGADCAGRGTVDDDPGAWSIAGTVPNAGSTLSLMTLTLMALGLVSRRFQRAAG